MNPTTYIAAFLTIRDWVFLAVGVLAGFYASLVAGRIMAFLTFRQTVLQQAQLLSAIIDSVSYDFDLKHGYNLDRMLHAYAVDAFCMGHRKASETLKDLGDEVEQMFMKIRRSVDHFNITKQKDKMLIRIAALRISWRAIFLGGPCASQVLQFYSEKERIWVQEACQDRIKNGQKITDYEEYSADKDVS
jgi:hypothetical protein